MVVAANDLIIDSLEEINAMTAGDPLNATDGAKGLTVLNRMIDTTNAGRGNISSERLDTYTLTIGKQNYSIGVDPSGAQTADLAGPRPMGLSRVNLLLSAPSNTVRRKVDLLTKTQWSQRSVINVAGMPIELYNDEADPLSTWKFYMIPDQAYQIEAYTWQQRAQIAAAIATGTVTTNGTAVTWSAGAQFPASPYFGAILINGVTYGVATYNSATSLTLSASAGVQASPVPFVIGGIATPIIVPPGYYEFWMYGLALRLAGPFGKPASQTTIAAFQDARYAITSLNAHSPQISTNSDFAGTDGGLYNWMSGMLDEDE